MFRVTVCLPALIVVAMALSCPPAWAGDGGFAGGPDLAAPSPTSIAVGDFNGDDRPDLVAATASAKSVSVRLARAGGDFDGPRPIDIGGRPRQVVVADFDADGKDDLAVSLFEDKLVRIRLGHGDGTFINATDVVLPRNPYSIVAGDFNADLKEDLAIAESDAVNGGGVSVRLGLGTGNFVAGGAVNAFVTTLVAGDFNADGNRDLAYGAFANGASGVLKGGAGGGLSVGPVIALPENGNALRSWAVGDFDADGNQDVAVAINNRSVVSVRLGNGDLTFRAAPDVPVGDGPYAVAVGDFDGDGREDLAVAVGGATTSSVRLGNGDGTFRTAPDVPARFANDVAVADFDGDGNDDLAFASLTDSVVSVRHGTGAPAPSGNLLVNGGFEGAGAATLPQTQSPAIPAWQSTGGMTFVRYGLASDALWPSQLDAPRLGAGGQSMLWGGKSTTNGGVAEAAQTVDVGTSAGAIDDGRATATLSGYLGGALAFGDRMSVRASFLDAGGAALGSPLELGPVTSTDRHGLTTLVRRAGRAGLPARTRAIRVVVTSVDDDKLYSTALADNVRLALDVTPAPQTPEAATGGAATATGAATTTTKSTSPQAAVRRALRAFGRDTRVTLSLGAKRKVRVKNANAFAVTATLAGKRLSIAAKSTRSVALKLSKQQRRKLARKRRLTLKLAAVVRDPAGHARTVRKQVRLRLKH